MSLRLDEALVARQLSPSRSRARDQINRGCVSVNGLAARKLSQIVSDTDRLEIADEAANYVSRAALKLVHALDHFQLSPTGKRCLDVGASTGGFTQVLLERGAAQVTAIDVGHGQMHADISDDPRVTSLESINARDFDGAFEFIVCDVSFISLKTALPKILDAAPPAAHIVALIKPQFEVGRENLPKDGIVKDPDLHQRVCSDISGFLESRGWRVLGMVPSPIEGGDGNTEFLIGAVKR
jgi:23S rRNA (cytidine1920-2'-O)/16S rRNA (cytidine1409-2'-O)-methyltransferase